MIIGGQWSLDYLYKESKTKCVMRCFKWREEVGHSYMVYCFWNDQMLKWLKRKSIIWSKFAKFRAKEKRAVTFAIAFTSSTLGFWESSIFLWFAGSAVTNWKLFSSPHQSIAPVWPEWLYISTVSWKRATKGECFIHLCQLTVLTRRLALRLPPSVLLHLSLFFLSSVPQPTSASG